MQTDRAPKGSPITPWRTNFHVFLPMAGPSCSTGATSMRLSWLAVMSGALLLMVARAASHHGLASLLLLGGNVLRQALRQRRFRQKRQIASPALFSTQVGVTRTYTMMPINRYLQLN